MIRFLQPGHYPKTLRLCSFDMSAGDVLELGGVGGGKVPEGDSLTINGKSSSADARVKAGDTVALQPNAPLG